MKLRTEYRLSLIRYLVNKGIAVHDAMAWTEIFEALGERPQNNTPLLKAWEYAKMRARKTRRKELRRNGVKAMKREEFYSSREWRKVRYEVLKASDGMCELCGALPEKGKPLHVDHIKSRSKHPELALIRSNLQVLCEDCNMGKSNRDDTDWRDRKLRLVHDSEPRLSVLMGESYGE